MQTARAPERRARPAARWAAPLLIAGIVTLFFWKLVLTDQFTWLASDDISGQVLPWFQYQASELRSGRMPLWDPYVWTGQPLLAQAQPGAVNPLNWVLFAVPMKHGWVRQSALHWHYILIRILAALAFYWLCRDLGLRRAASLFGGVLYGTAGYVGSVDWPQMVSGAVPVPLVFLFQFRAFRGATPVRSAVLSGFFLGLTWLSGHHQLPLYVSLASSVVWLYFTFRHRSYAKCAALAVLVAFLFSAVQTLPTAEYGRLAVRWAGADHALEWHERVGYDVHQLYSLKPLSLWSVVVPGADLNTNPFIGAVAFALVCAGFIAASRDPRVRIFGILMIGSVLIALGPSSVVHGWFYSLVPMADKARVPSQSLILFHLGACAVAAWGIDRFPSLTRRRIAGLAAVLAAFGGLLACAGLILWLARILPLNGDTRFMITAAASIAGAAVLWAWSRQMMAVGLAVAALLLLALLEIGNTGGNYVFANYTQKDRTAKLRQMAEDADIVEFLRVQPGGPFRVDYDGEAFPHNIGDWWGIEAFSANAASAPSIVMRNDPYSPRVQAMMGVRYYLGTKPLRDGQVEVFSGASGRKVYRNPTAFPRAWAVHSTTRVAVQDTARTLGDPAIDLRTTAIVTRDHPQLESCGGDSVRLTEHLPDRVVIHARMVCRGMVVLSETYFQGWRVVVDGNPAEIYDANGFVRGVIVEAGEHRIEMTYRPASVMVGGALSLAGALIALVAAFVSRRELHG